MIVTYSLSITFAPGPVLMVAGATHAWNAQAALRVGILTGCVHTITGRGCADGRRHNAIAHDIRFARAGRRVSDTEPLRAVVYRTVPSVATTPTKGPSSKGLGGIFGRVCGRCGSQLFSRRHPTWKTNCPAAVGREGFSSSSGRGVLGGS